MVASTVRKGFSCRMVTFTTIYGLIFKIGYLEDRFFKINKSVESMSILPGFFNLMEEL